jgi:hypothetical protein
MSKRYTILLVIAGVFIFFLWGREEEVSPRISTISEELIQAEETPPEKTIIRRTSGEISKSEIKLFHDSLPHTEDVKLEVRENPHVPPSSLIRFAEKLGPLMEKAKRNPDDAELLVNELSACVSEEDLIVSARSVCLTKAEELARNYPKLENDVEKIRKQSQEDAIELNQKMNEFDKKKGAL